MLPIERTETPESADEVAAVVREAAGRRQSVYPVGAGTSLGRGVYPSRPGVGLSLAGLNRVLDFAARDLTVTVEAGYSINELDRLLANQRLRLPIDVPHRDRATLGGLLSVNPSGARRFARGTFRDYVVAIEAVDGRAVAFTSGKPVVKNAAGYDVGKLLIGSLGTLGIITRATLTVRPIPDCSAIVACGLPSFGLANRLLEQRVQSPTLPVAMEHLIGPAWLSHPTFGRMATSSAGCLALGFEGTQAEVQWMVATVCQEWAAAGAPSPCVVSDPSESEVWQPLADFGGPDTPNAGNHLQVAIRVLPSKSIQAAQGMLRALPGCSIQIHAGDGAMEAACDLTEPGEARELVAKLRSGISGFGGRMVVTSHPREALLTRSDVWGPRSEADAVSQSLKREFDPDHVLNPGRFIFEDR